MQTLAAALVLSSSIHLLRLKPDASGSLCAGLKVSKESTDLRICRAREFLVLFSPEARCFLRAPLF